MKVVKDWGALVAVLLAIIAGVARYTNLERDVSDLRKKKVIMDIIKPSLDIYISEKIEDIHIKPIVRTDNQHEATIKKITNAVYEGNTSYEIDLNKGTYLVGYHLYLIEDKNTTVRVCIEINRKQFASSEHCKGCLFRTASQLVKLEKTTKARLKIEGKIINDDVNISSFWAIQLN